jgi:general secretion pathway protein I
MPVRRLPTDRLPTRAFSSEVDTGSRRENASKQKAGAPFRFSRSGKVSDRSDAGFTILEVLIALAVVTVSILAIGQLMSNNARGVRKLESHVALVQSAQTVLSTEIPERSKLSPGRLTGRNGDTRWQIDVGPVAGDWIADKEDVEWIPELVKLRVRGPDGGTLDLETVRLMRRPKQ